MAKADSSIPASRALAIFGDVPRRFKAVPIANDRHAPDLRAGQFAVLDCSDCVPRPGMLFLLQYPESYGKPAYTVFVECTEQVDPSWCMGWPRPEWHISFGCQTPIVIGVNDGSIPWRIRCNDMMDDDLFRERVIGRVVGVLAPVLDGGGRSLERDI